MTKDFENKAFLVKRLGHVLNSIGGSRAYYKLSSPAKELDNSNLHGSAWGGHELVGIAKAITDFGYCCNLSDLAICKEYQGSGIDKVLISLLRKGICRVLRKIGI